MFDQKRIHPVKNQPGHNTDQQPEKKKIAGSGFRGDNIL